MGSLKGHVSPGIGFLIIGLWHLFNHTKLHLLNPNTYTSQPWFSPPPLMSFSSPLLRYLELILIMGGSLTSIAMELFVGPHYHHPLDPKDYTIPSYHLHNFEHSSISLSIFVYASFAILIDRAKGLDTGVKLGLTQVLATLAFCQELLMFHLHSTDHEGLEGQYHWLLQIIIVMSLLTTLAAAWKPRSFLVSFVRSVSIAFQGVWFIMIGYGLYIPGLVPKGCYNDVEGGRLTVKCRSDEALMRAKSLVNIEFSWFCTWMVVFSVGFYLVYSQRYVKDKEYVALEFEEEDLEAQKKKMNESHERKGFASFELA